MISFKFFNNANARTRFYNLASYICLIWKVFSTTVWYQPWIIALTENLVYFSSSFSQKQNEKQGSNSSELNQQISIKWYQKLNTINAIFTVIKYATFIGYSSDDIINMWCSWITGSQDIFFNTLQLEWTITVF